MKFSKFIAKTFSINGARFAVNRGKNNLLDLTVKIQGSEFLNKLSCHDTMEEVYSAAGSWLAQGKFTRYQGVLIRVTRFDECGFIGEIIGDDGIIRRPDAAAHETNKTYVLAQLKQIVDSSLKVEPIVRFAA